MRAWLEGTCGAEKSSCSPGGVPAFGQQKTLDQCGIVQVQVSGCTSLKEAPQQAPAVWLT
eukprot:18130-Chlamydomonas_euryale.AAC.2